MALQPLEKAPVLKGKLFSCYSDCNICCDLWIQLKILKMIGLRNCPITANCPITLSDYNFAD